MILGIVVIVLLGAGTVVFVAAPLLRVGRPQQTESDRASRGALRELHARQQMLLAALKDLEDDRSTDKVGEPDYAELKQRLSAEAMEVMRQLDVAEQEREQNLERERAASRPLRYPGARRSDPSP